MILVTGATGHIGRPLVYELEARGATFRILARDHDKTLALFPSADIVEADSTNHDPSQPRWTV